MRALLSLVDEENLLHVFWLQSASDNSRCFLVLANRFGTPELVAN